MRSFIALIRPGVPLLSSSALRRLLTATCLLALPAVLDAQMAHFDGFVLGSGFNGPSGVAVDSIGDVFVADQGNNAIKEIVAINGVISSQSQILTLGSGFNQPQDLVVDSGGNVFVADYGNNKVKEIVAPGYTTVLSLGNSYPFNRPAGVALDPSGNIFVADQGSVAIQKIAAPGYSAVLSLGSGFSNPVGVAVDSIGDVFVAEWNDPGALKELVAPGYSTVNTISSAFNRPIAVALDSDGNLFVADSDNNALKEILAVGGYTTINSLGGGFSGPNGVAVDSHGNVFVADTNNNAVKEIIAGAEMFPPTEVGSTGASVELYFTFDSGGLLAATPYLVLTQGKQNNDFQAAATQDGNACVTGNTYSSGGVGTVTVTFTPTRPGQRLGAVQLMGLAGTPIATGPISGTGTGPMVTFSPAAESTVGSGFNAPTGAAVDGSGDVFVADYAHSAVKEIVAVNGAVSSRSTVHTVGSGFSYPFAVSVDGSGDVFVADYLNNAVKEIVAVNGVVSASSTVNTVGSGFSYPTGLAVDGGGDVFVADNNNNAVKEIVAVNGTVSSSSTVNTVGNGFSYPYGLAVDGSGDVFVADFSHNAVKEIVAINGAVSSGSTVNTVGSGFSQPRGVAVDGSGNVFVADGGSNAVKEIVAINGVVSSSSTVNTVGSGFFEPTGVSVDGGGNVFVADFYHNAVKELNFAAPPALSFAPTVVGAISSDSPQSVTITNDGNAALSFPDLGSAGANPTGAADFPLDSSTTCPEVSSSGTPDALAAGSSCIYAINFMPTAAGSTTGLLSVTDTSLNAVGPGYATQSITLSGAGIAPDATHTTVTALPSPVTAAQPVMLTATVSDTTTPATVPTGGVSFTDTVGTTLVSLNGGVAVPLVAGTATLPVTLTVVGVHTITANYAGVSGTIAGSTGSASLTLAAIVPTLSFTPIAAQTYGNPPFAVSATSASTGAVTYAVVSGPATIAGNIVTLTGAGPVVLSASQAASGNYATASATTSFTVTAEAPTLSFGPIAAQTYGNPPFAVSAGSASTGLVTYTVVSGRATLSGNIVTLTGAGAVVLLASQVASANYAAATANASFMVTAEAPTLSFGPIAAQTYGNPPFAVSATSASSGAVTYAVVSGSATIAVNMVTLTGAGTVALTASQAASGNYTAAIATTSFTVAAIVPVLTFAPIPAQTYGNAPFAVSATSASTGAVTYSVVSGPASISGSTVTLTGAGTVALSAGQAASGNYAAATATTSFTVAAAAGATVPTLSFAPIPPRRSATRPSQ
jgi:sugar lactone lactonase YvrE